MMASGMNYAGGSMNEYAGAGMHGASMRAGPSRSSTRFGSAVRNPEHADPWDQISDEHRSEINDCVSGYTPAWRHARMAICRAVMGI